MSRTEIAAMRAEVQAMRETVAGFRELVSDIRRENELERPLVCVECGCESDDGAEGWRTYLTDDAELATYCPDCAREEFGDA